MIAADTNVWARVYLNDDPAQTPKARSALAQARSQDGIFVPLVVLAELAWVLGDRWKKDRVLNTVEDLLQMQGVTVESPLLAQRALQAARQSPAGFADHLIAEIAFEFGASEIITFDKDFAKQPHVRRLKS